MTLTLENVGVFVGVGGSLATPTTPDDWSTSSVVNGTLGFGATVSTLTLVSIKDRGADAVLTTDDTTYLGVALEDFDGNLVGLDDVLVFHAYDVDALVNKAADSDAADAGGQARLERLGAAPTTRAWISSARSMALNGTELGALTRQCGCGAGRRGCAQRARWRAGGEGRLRRSRWVR